MKIKKTIKSLNTLLGQSKHSGNVRCHCSILSLLIIKHNEISGHRTSEKREFATIAQGTRTSIFLLI